MIRDNTKESLTEISKNCSTEQKDYFVVSFRRIILLRLINLMQPHYMTHNQYLIKFIP